MGNDKMVSPFGVPVILGRVIIPVNPYEVIQRVISQEERKVAAAGSRNIPPKTPKVTGHVPSTDPVHYIEELAKSWEMDVNNSMEMLRRLCKASSGAYFSLMMYIVAKDLDMKYPDPITKAGEIWYFSNIDRNAYKTTTKGINKSTFKYFAAFRTKEDLSFALKMVDEVKKLLFCGRK